MSEEEELAEKTLKSNMVEGHVILYGPFYSFMKEYLAFFGSKQTVEGICRAMICDSVGLLYQELDEFASNPHKHIEKGAWFNRWPHIACVSWSDERDEEEA